MERRERKRPRPTWDVLPSPPSQARREPEGVSRLVEHGERGRVDCRLAVADAGSSRASPPMRDDDREGHYVFDLGENLTPRYKILSKIGEGTFGRVLECWDRETREYVAIKVVRSIRKYRDAAMVEIDVLNRLTKNDITGLRCKGLGWTYPCDIWSIGCILVELCSGETLFQTHENFEHLAMMERVLGPLPVQMVRKASQSAEKYFRRGARLNWPEGAVSRESIRAVRKLDRLKNLICQHVDHSGGVLTDLLQGLLAFDPAERLTAHEALNHPFFKGTT